MSGWFCAVARLPHLFVCSHGRPHLLPADLGGPMVEAAVGAPSGSCPGRQMGNKESAAPAMETRMLGLAGSVGSFVACVVRRALSVPRTQHKFTRLTFDRAHGWNGEAERRAQSAVFFWDERSSQSGRKMAFGGTPGEHFRTNFRAHFGLAWRAQNELAIGASRKMHWGTKCEPILGSPGEPKMSAEIGTKMFPRCPPRSPFSDHSARAARPPKNTPDWAGCFAFPSHPCACAKVRHA